LLLAVPRPRVLGRCLEDAAALGFGRVVLFRTRRVEKGWLESHVLAAESTRRHLLLGLEQSRRTRLPVVELFPLFRPFVEDRLAGIATPGQRFLAHLTGAVPTASLALAAGEPFTLAVGPEGGFVEFEVELLRAQGFTA
jgi:RsmE family RNA methyltransferase